MNNIQIAVQNATIGGVGVVSVGNVILQSIRQIALNILL